MRVTIYRASCQVHQRDWLVMEWEVFTWGPRPSAHKRAGAGFLKVRTATLPVEIEVPIGSRLVNDENGRTYLATHFHPLGFDAASVWHLAIQGQRGFRLVLGSQAAPEVPAEQPPAAAEADPVERFQLSA